MPTEEYFERKKQYIKGYQKSHYANVSFNVRLDTDKDIMDKLKSVPDKSNYLKTLIRDDIKKHG